MQQLAVYLFTAKSLYMFRVSSHPSSGVHKTVTTASGTGHIIGVATAIQRGHVYETIINNCPTKWNNEQSIYLLQGHSTCFGFRHTHHQEYIKL